MYKLTMETPDDNMKLDTELDINDYQEEIADLIDRKQVDSITVFLKRIKDDDENFLEVVNYGIGYAQAQGKLNIVELLVREQIAEIPASYLKTFILPYNNADETLLSGDAADNLEG